MKRFFAFFTAILITISIAACSSSTSSDTGYPFQIGTWSVQSSQRADWTGSTVNAQNFAVASSVESDTVHITQPDTLTMYAISTSEPQGFAIIMNDTTLAFSETENIDAISTIENASGITFHNGALTTNNDVKGTIIQFQGSYDCNNDSTGGNSATLIYALTERYKSIPFKVYSLDVSGFRQMLNMVVCGAPIE